MFKIVIYVLMVYENENETYFQQDGAPPHFPPIVINFLDRTFREGYDEEEVLRSSRLGLSI